MFLLPKKMDTIEDHHSKHTIEDQGCSWNTPLKNCLDAVFICFFKGTLYSQLIIADGSSLTLTNCFFGQQLDTIEDHHNKHIIYLGSLLLMKKTEK